MVLLRRFFPVILLTAAGFSGSVLAADADFTIAIRNHRFEPAEIQVPAGIKFRMVVRNMDSTPEEFESHSLKREKIVPGNGEAIILLGPLKPGTYDFFGDFNQKTANGRMVAK